MKKPFALLFANLLACLVLVSCGSISDTPVKAKFLGELVESTVDSETARYYLENYLQGKRENRELDARISELYARHANALPSRESLKQISQQFSVDFASLFLVDRLLFHECNRKLNLSFSHFLNQDAPISARLSDYIVLFVPGWDYAENGALTGADFAKPRGLATQFGLENYLVELPPTGSVSENTDALVAEIARHSRSGKKILLAGASSAGPAIHLALGERLGAKERSTIKAWLNLGGILQGSPLIDYLQATPQRWLFNLVVWYKAWNKEAILSMSTSPSRERFSRLQIDPEILIINYLGVPLSGQLSKYSGDKYPLLRSEGPNDGLTLLTDVIAPHSLTVIALGSDHFFAEDPRIDQKTIALMKLIISYLEQDTARACH